MQKLTIPTMNFSVLTFQELIFINIHTIIWVVLIYFPDTFTSVWLKMQFPISHMKLNGILHKSQACKTWAKHQQTVIMPSSQPVEKKGKISSQSLELFTNFFFFFLTAILLHHEKHWAGRSTSWDQDCREKYQ